MNARSGLKFSHVGFFVTDLDQQADFYSNVLEFTITDRGFLPGPDGPVQLVFLSRDPDEHHQIVLISGRPAEISFNVINQISLKADSVTTLQQFHHRLKSQAVTELTPVTHGNALSVYFRDPEGNRVELYVDTPWYVSQPCRVPAPIELPPEELMTWAEMHARTLEGFRPRQEWRRDMATRMGVTE
jgi:catechol 2,3-dioxygenase-like lactoylglutathione lyase family enzyme